jgi:hypothetical protein
VATFLGNNISINYKDKTLFIHQGIYTKKLLKKFSIYNLYKPILIPGEPGIKLRKSTSQASKYDINKYQKQIGSILYLALKTRPNITFSTTNYARYISNPNNEYFNALNRIWKYLLKYLELGLIYNYNRNDLFIKGYSNSN